jgi:RNA 2',3'-cyclic 3'-phosphodiesterase
MHMFAAIVPPRDVLEDVTRVVRSATAPEPEPPRRRLFGRRPGGGRDGSDRVGQDTASGAAVLTASPELDTVPAAAMYLPLTAFGNVTRGDSLKLADALRTEAATWRPATVSLAGGTALEFPGDESVWAKLDGDLDALMAVGRGVPMVVQRLGFFVDRRVFRPWLSVGTITSETSAPFLEKVVASLEAYRSRPWTIDHISFMRRPMDADVEVPYEEVERMPLAGG